MTIEQILELSVDDLEKMTDAQLMEHFKQYLDVTRPDRAQKKTQPQVQMPYLSPQKKAAIEALKGEGIDFSFLTNRKKR